VFDCATLTEEHLRPKGYRRTTITKAQRAELLRDLQRRYRERKAQQLAKEKEGENKTPASD
jgi:hypothetical protein